MGQEIDSAIFCEGDFEIFYQRLKHETQILEQKFQTGELSKRNSIAGFELEAWLIDQAMRAAPENEAFLLAFNEPLAFPELARFNIELNNDPLKLEGNALSRMKSGLESIWSRAQQQAELMNLNLLLIGILPTIEKAQLNVSNMTRLNRYRALNEQILAARGEPIKLEITGREYLKYEHQDVMLESAATSFQLHLQVPYDRAHHYYNAAILASFATVGVSANSPFLFGKSLWEETRIPLFEQAVEVGGYRGAAHGPLRRVSFGSGYARETIFECFQENLEHFPVLLPRLFESGPEAFAHLKLQNGTIWRWNRPLVGMDENGMPHIRIEHRVIPAGPTIPDMIANAAFSYGLIEFFSHEFKSSPLIFSQAKDNFYQAARHGLEGSVVWTSATKMRLKDLILRELLPRARDGLQILNITDAEIEYFLGLINERVSSGRTGAQWQQQYLQKYSASMSTMTAVYLENQRQARPVNEWSC